MSYSEKSDTGVCGACIVEGSIPSALFDLGGRRAYSSKLCFGCGSQPLSHGRAVKGGNSFLSGGNQPTIVPAMVTVTGGVKRYRSSSQDMRL